MLLSANTGIVRATTRPPSSRARRDGRSWPAVRSSSPAAMVRTFQFRGRLAWALIPASNSTSWSENPCRHPSTIASSVVPG